MLTIKGGLSVSHPTNENDKKKDKRNRKVRQVDDSHMLQCSRNEICSRTGDKSF